MLLGRNGPQADQQARRPRVRSRARHLLNGVESGTLGLQPIVSRMCGELRLPRAPVRRVEQHQATMFNGLRSADHSPTETTIAYKQAAVAVSAAIAQAAPAPYQALTYRFGVQEDFDQRS